MDQGLEVGRVIADQLHAQRGPGPVVQFEQRLLTEAQWGRDLDEGWAVVIPGVHEFRRYPLHDQVYRPDGIARGRDHCEVSCRRIAV